MDRQNNATQMSHSREMRQRTKGELALMSDALDVCSRLQFMADICTRIPDSEDRRRTVAHLQRTLEFVEGRVAGVRKVLRYVSPQKEDIAPDGTSATRPVGSRALL